MKMTTHYDPITQHVSPDNPVITDPNATVAWSGNLEPQFRKDISFKTFLGRGSGESIQMLFAVRRRRLRRRAAIRRSLHATRAVNREN